MFKSVQMHQNTAFIVKAGKGSMMVSVYTGEMAGDMRTLRWVMWSDSGSSLVSLQHRCSDRWESSGWKKREDVEEKWGAQEGERRGGHRERSLNDLWRAKTLLQTVPDFTQLNFRMTGRLFLYAVWWVRCWVGINHSLVLEVVLTLKCSHSFLGVNRQLLQVWC